MSTKKVKTEKKGEVLIERFKDRLKDIQDDLKVENKEACVILVREIGEVSKSDEGTNYKGRTYSLFAGNGKEIIRLLYDAFMNNPDLVRLVRHTMTMIDIIDESTEIVKNALQDDSKS